MATHVPYGPDTAMPSLCRTLDLLRPYLPRELVSPPAFTRIGTAIAHLPAAITRNMYVECRLGTRTPDAPADLVFLVCDTVRALLADGFFRVPPGNPAAASCWQRLAEFCRISSDPASRLYTLCGHLWLEYDVSPAATTRDFVPSVFMSLHRPSAAYATHDDAVNALTALGWQGSSVALSALRACFEHLPSTARVHYLGLMLGRPDATIRVCAAGLPLDAAVLYLSNLTGATPGRLLPVARAAAASHAPDGIPRIGMVHVDIDTMAAYFSASAWSARS